MIEKNYGKEIVSPWQTMAIHVTSMLVRLLWRPRYYLASEELAMPWSAEYKRNNPHLIITANMLCNARKRARHLGIPFDLTIEYLRELAFATTHCPLLGIELRWKALYGCGNKNNHPHFNSPSLDRIVPATGYIRGNVAIISHKANTMKSNASVEEIITLSKRIRPLVAQIVMSEIVRTL